MYLLLLLSVSYVPQLCLSDTCHGLSYVVKSEKVKYAKGK